MITEYGSLVSKLRMNNALRRNPDCVESYQASAFLEDCQNFETMILFGAGELGRETARRLRGTGIKLFFTDNNESLWNTEIDYIPCIPPKDAIDLYGNTTPFVATIFNPSQITEYLWSQGVRKVIPATVLWRGMPGILAPWHGFTDKPGNFVRSAGYIRPVMDLWADDLSRKEFSLILNWFTQPFYRHLPYSSDPAEIYFPPEILRYCHEVFVDVGAYTGDTIERFLVKWRGWSAIHAFEPDPENFAALEKTVRNLREDVQGEIERHSYALGRFNSSSRIDGEGAAAHLTQEQADRQVAVRTLDSLQLRPTYIKVDVEGHEKDVIAGMAETIKRDMPVLAICLYHEPHDFWEIPREIHRIAPGYKLLLRRYAEDCWETVLYAVPEERFLST